MNVRDILILKSRRIGYNSVQRMFFREYNERFYENFIENLLKSTEKVRLVNKYKSIGNGNFKKAIKVNKS